MDQVFVNSVTLYSSILILLKKIKIHTEAVKSNLQEKSSFSDHSKWEFLKYKIYKFFISLWKNLAKTEQIIQTNLENRIKALEQILKIKF